MLVEEFGLAFWGGGEGERGMLVILSKAKKLLLLCPAEVGHSFFVFIP